MERMITFRLVWKSRSALKWLGVGGLALVFVAVGFAAFRTHQAAEHEKRARDAFNYTMLGFANYYEAHGCLPDPVLFDDDGSPRASWRVIIINYLDASPSLIPDEKKPWIDSDKTEIDLEEFAKKVRLYCFWDKSGSTATRIAAVTGPDTAFDESNRCRFLGLDADTILLVEVVGATEPWTHPGDFVWDPDPRQATAHELMRIGGENSRGFHVAFRDDTIWLLAPETPMIELSRFFTAAGARENDRDERLGRYRR
jgi:hypothetical protein